MSIESHAPQWPSDEAIHAQIMRLEEIVLAARDECKSRNADFCMTILNMIERSSRMCATGDSQAVADALGVCAATYVMGGAAHEQIVMAAKRN